MAEKTIMSPWFLSFMASPAGRWLRVAAGLGLMTGGLQARSKKGYFLAALGIVPLAAGSLDFCLLGPIFAGHFWGKDIRRALHAQQGYPNLGTHAVSWVSS